ncbi:MAG: M23 family metallopeptidase [Candidatus Peregrinibacteria bacterium]|nr:M23 family metallopeptidase [Candidatus Peregrinibacteria bacterium]
MEVIEQTLQVNEFARRNRHLKIFSKGGLVRMNIGYFFSSALNSVKKLVNNPVFVVVRKTLGVAKMTFSSVLPVSPQRKLLAQSVFIAISALFVTSLTSGGTFAPTETGYSSDYLSAYTLPGDVLISDDSGYLIKVNPPTDESNRIGLTDYAVHTVEGGETMSVIAKKYSVKVETIMWENNIANSNSLRVGQKLLIPPVDGVSYKVASGESIDKIAKKYKISTDSIIAQNGLGKDAVFKGQELFLPGAKPIEAPNLVIARNPTAARSYRSSISAAPSTSRPDIGKMFIFPTIGGITQGFHSGHYALDIANRAMPPIWAAAGGTVVKASSGTWGGGYGNHVIIDHGNGVKTLYGHMDSLNVVEGQYVNQGDVIGVMGHTGHVYGVTGIHLHWEVIVNGVKVNPIGYY